MTSFIPIQTTVKKINVSVADWKFTGKMRVERLLSYQEDSSPRESIIINENGGHVKERRWELNLSWNILHHSSENQSPLSFTTQTTLLSSMRGKEANLDTFLLIRGLQHFLLGSVLLVLKWFILLVN